MLCVTKYRPKENNLFMCNQNMFISFQKDRLTYYAVPTEDGPFCDSSVDNKESEQGAANIYSLVLNESEGDEKYVKKHNSSIIYADFLTNGDNWEKLSLNETIWNNKVVTNEPNSQSVKRNNIDVPPKDEFIEDSLITLPKSLPDDISCKITEFDNPILSDINYANNENTDKIENVSTHNKKIKRTKKLVSSRSSNQQFNSLLLNQEPFKTYANLEPNVAPTNQDLNDLLLNQENNNIIANLNDINKSSNIVIEQITDLKWPDKQDAIIIPEKNDQLFLHPTEKQYSETSAPNDENLIILKNPKEVPVQFEATNNYDIKQDFKANISFGVQQENQNREDKIEKRRKPKIRILFEEKITEPITITDKLEPVLPSMFINVPRKKEKTSELQTRKKKSDIKNIKDNNLPNTSTPGDVVNKVVEDVKPSLQRIQNNGSSDKPVDIVSKMLALKHKISLERMAAIEKKRNFNKKLRDIIEICLEKLDEQDKSSENNTVANSPKEIEPNEKVKSLKQNVGSYLSKQTDLPNAHEYTMKFMEARMQRMENILLNKIEQNSQKIVELKKCMESKQQVSKSSATQTSLDEESHKKQLYQELSKFLSPSASSLVYEELFLNKYAQKISNQPSPKRRKRR